MKTNHTVAGRAFGKQAVQFDKNQIENPVLEITRRQVREEALRFVHPGEAMLEINAGTGIDAVFFSRLGCTVLATDISDGMIEQAKMKAEEHHLQDLLRVECCSFHHLQTITDQKFDFIFSNFGGLNCTDDLPSVFAQFPRLLKPNGYVTMALLSPVCPWELSYMLQGNLRLAIRRLKRRNVTAHLEGEYFPVDYYTPSEVIRAFPPGFKKVSLTGLAPLLPPPYMENFPKIFPRVFRFLTTVDAVARKIPPFTWWGDYFILTMKYEHPS